MSTQVPDMERRDGGELAAGTERTARRTKRHWKTVPVTVVLPDCSAYFMELREDCKGYDCLAKVNSLFTYTLVLYLST